MTDPAEIFAQSPATQLSHMIRYDEDFPEAMLAEGYREAGKRLAESHTGKPWDDVTLMPMLFLWRQAIELVLKDTIRDLAKERRKRGDSDPALVEKAVNARLLGRKGGIGHDMQKLVADYVGHLNALGAELPPTAVLDTLDVLSEVDNGGTGFRYSGVIKSASAEINLEHLTARLDEAFTMLSVTIDTVTQGQGV